MKTVTKEFRVYDFEELSEKAQEKAYQKWYEIQDFACSDEYRDTMKAFEEAFNVKVYDWNVDTCNYDYRFRLNDMPEFKFEDENRKTLKEKIRVSKYIIGRLDSKKDTTNCIFTGFCADCDILGIYNMVKNWQAFFLDYDSFIRASLENFFSAWSKDMEYSFSMENFKENYANEESYLENGKVFYE